ncbi:nucleoside hydrolase [Bacillus sp. DJP31]|uniref:nucleoside hydrolase n=1 Tax=Bacillus sp. DJP31 TaxID=3409789 RepID=UPI003BB5CE25
MGKKVLFFSDVGIDDKIALGYGYLNDQIEIIGVVADYGNASRDQTVKNVQYLFRLFNYPKDVLIIGGAVRPMSGEDPDYFPDIHGPVGLGPIIPDGPDVVEIENFYEVINLIKKNKKELIIVTTGRLSSLATLFILYPSLMKEIKEFYIMGGAFWVPGNITAVAEANFYADPRAVEIVLKYAENVTIIPLNVTNRAIVTPEMVDYIYNAGQFSIIKPLLDYYFQFYKKRDPSIKGSPVHDAITLMAVLHSDMFTFRKFPVEMVQKDGISKGQSIVDIRRFGEIVGKKQHRIAFDFNYSYFFNDFLATMTGQYKMKK